MPFNAMSMYVQNAVQYDTAGEGGQQYAYKHLMLRLHCKDSTPCQTQHRSN